MIRINGRLEKRASAKVFFKVLMLIAIILIIFISGRPLLADDTLMGESGHTVYPINTNKIQMEYEHVVIKMDGSDSHRMASVRCEFEFVNTSSEEIKAKVGFPGNEFTDNPFIGSTAPDLTLFTALVDGVEKSVETRREVIKEENYEDEESLGKKTRITVTDYRNWYTWDVTFPPKKRVSIKKTYSITPSSDSVKWFVEYVLVTGANWKGNIGQAIIEVWYPSEEDLKMRVLEIKPQGYTIQGKRIKWDLRNIKPRENIAVVEKWIR